jgi:hypothetical protein
MSRELFSLPSTKKFVVLVMLASLSWRRYFLLRPSSRRRYKGKDPLERAGKEGEKVAQAYNLAA